MDHHGQEAGENFVSALLHPLHSSIQVPPVDEEKHLEHLQNAQMQPLRFYSEQPTH